MPSTQMTTVLPPLCWFCDDMKAVNGQPCPKCSEVAPGDVRINTRRDSPNWINSLQEVLRKLAGEERNDGS